MYDWRKRAIKLIEEQRGNRKQQEFAREIGMDPAYLNHKLKGRRKATEDDVAAIAAGLGMTPEQLTTDPDKFVISKIHSEEHESLINQINSICDDLANRGEEQKLEELYNTISNELKRINKKKKTTQ